MAKKNFKEGITQTIAHRAAVETLPGVRLSDVVQELPSKFHVNPLNNEFFSEETTEYFDNLRQDVQERGIIVPIIAKKDGTLLAGHNRLRIAKELRLPVIPVQYILNPLSDEEERIFVINDNLIRRQLSNADRIRLYKIRYPNFDERLNARSNGRPKDTNDATEKKGERFPLSENKSNTPLNASVIARDTGQSREAVKKQLQQYKKEQPQKKNPQHSEQVQATDTHKQGKQDKSVDMRVVKKIEKDLVLVASANEVTQKEVIKTLKAFMKQH